MTNCVRARLTNCRAVYREQKKKGKQEHAVRVITDLRLKCLENGANTGPECRAGRKECVINGGQVERTWTWEVSSQAKSRAEGIHHVVQETRVEGDGQTRRSALTLT